MNTICDTKQVFGVWLVDTRTPGGTHILVNHKGTLREARKKALRAKTA